MSKPEQDCDYFVWGDIKSMSGSKLGLFDIRMKNRQDNSIVDIEINFPDIKRMYLAIRRHLKIIGRLSDVEKAEHNPCPACKGVGYVE